MCVKKVEDVRAERVEEGVVGDERGVDILIRLNCPISVATPHLYSRHR
jgi:hypothetical protein